MGMMSMATLSEQADALEYRMATELERRARQIRSPIFTAGVEDGRDARRSIFEAAADGEEMLMGPDPHMAPMPVRPTLMDFFRLRFGNTQHVMQSARLALLNGYGERAALACLLHDISVTAFLNPDHGYWAAAMIEPYVDEEISWAVRAHQILRFFPDPAVGYEYPEAYRKYFGPHFVPEPYIRAEYERMKDHKYYTMGRIITINDIYAFDPDVTCQLEDFEAIIGRHFRQPAEGLGFDGSQAAHIWRTIMWPTRAL